MISHYLKLLATIIVLQLAVPFIDSRNVYAQSKAIISDSAEVSWLEIRGGNREIGWEVSSLDNSGKLKNIFRGRFGNRSQDAMCDLDKRETTVVFEAVKYLINYCAFGEMYEGASEDGVSIDVKVDNSSPFHFSISEPDRRRKEIQLAFSRLYQIFPRSETNFSENWRPDLVKQFKPFPEGVVYPDRFPNRARRPWYLYLGNLIISDARISSSSSGIAIPLSKGDDDRRYRIARAMLNSFQLHGKGSDEQSKKLVKVAMLWGKDASSVSFECSHQDLVEMGIFEELNHWRDEINRRARTTHFQAPWE